MTPSTIATDLRARMDEELQRLRGQLAYAMSLRDVEGAGYPAAFGWLKGSVNALFAQFGVEKLMELEGLQAGSGEHQERRPPTVGGSAISVSAPAAGEGTPWVCDCEAEATADALCGEPVDSAVSRVFGEVGRG